MQLSFWNDLTDVSPFHTANSSINMDSPDDNRRSEILSSPFTALLVQKDGPVSREEKISLYRSIAASRHARLTADEKSLQEDLGGEWPTTTSHVTALSQPDRNVDTGETGAQQAPSGPTVTDLPQDQLAEMPVLDGLQALPELHRAEMEFSWELYLQEMNAHPVPHLAFEHVKKSLENGLEDGQYLEYVYPIEGGKKAFWYVELLHARGPEVLVQYYGLEAHPEETFWLDLRTAEVYSFGCCDKKVHNCRPPKIVCKYRAYLGDLLEKSKRGLPSPSSKDLAAGGVPMKDRFEVGLWVEVIDDEKPATIWPAVVEKNIGGRLLLKLRKPRKWDEGDNPPELTDEEEGVGLWIFCTDPRLQALGRGLKSNFKYGPPNGLNLSEKDIEETKNIVSEHMSGQTGTYHTDLEAIPDVFTPFTSKVTPFVKGYYVEFLHPHNKHQIFPAVISDVFSDGTMAVEILDFRPEGKKEKIVKICRHNSLDVLPVHWGAKNGVRLRCPGLNGEFDWKRFVADHGGSLAPEKWFPHLIPLKNSSYLNRFQRGMKLEVSNPSEPEELCTATVVKIIAPLLWVHIDSYGQSSTHCLPFNSTEMFPIGFCGSNDYPLKLPRLMTHGRRMATIRPLRSQSQNTSPAKSPRSEPASDSPAKQKEKSICPDTVTVYINPKCNCGPLMNLKKLIHLPKWIGPGPVQLVLESVITSMISCGSKQAKMLQMINASGDGPKSANWERVKIKAKIGGRRQMGQIDVVKNVSQVPDFLRNVCIQYEACPNLITTEPLVGRCPERCHQFTKPDPKVPIIRKKPMATGQGQKAQESSENVDLDASFQSDADALKESQTTNSQASQDESDEDLEQTESQAGMDDDVDTLMGSAAPSRAPSPESDPLPVRNGKPSRERSQDYADELEPPRKKSRRGINFAKPGSKFYEALTKESSAASVVPTKKESSSSSGSESEESVEVPEPLNMREIKAEQKQSTSSDTDIRVSGGRIVDDSEYLLWFYKHPVSWTVDDVYKFLKRHLPPVSRCPDVLKQEGVDGDALLLMIASDVTYLGLEVYDSICVGNLIERIIFSLLINYNQKVPLYATWK